MPPAATSPDQRPRAPQGMVVGEGADDLGAGGTVDVQDIELVAGREADVGLGMLGPPGQHPGPIGCRLLEAVRNESAEGMLGGLAAARIPARAARPYRPGRQRSAAGGLEVAPLGEG
jgi:hypothetical protein